MNGPLKPDILVAIALLEAESQRQLQLREEHFGGGNLQSAKAAGDLAFAYRAAAEFLRSRQPVNG